MFQVKMIPMERGRECLVEEMMPPRKIEEREVGKLRRRSIPVCRLRSKRTAGQKQTGRER